MSNTLTDKNETAAKHFYRASAADFKKIPGCPLAYWLSNNVMDIFQNNPCFDDSADIRAGLQTGDTAKFLRLWFEVPNPNIGFGSESRESAKESKKQWFPLTKGGEYRKWYGNNEYLVNWRNDGEDIHKYHNLPSTYNGAPVRAKNFYFRRGVTWTLITSGVFGARVFDSGMIFDISSHSLFSKSKNLNIYLAIMCSKLGNYFIKALNPTLNTSAGVVSRLPDKKMDGTLEEGVIDCAESCIKISKKDWNSYETSWSFECFPLLQSKQILIANAYEYVRASWRLMVEEVQALEEENNCIFIEAYGLQNELTPEVSLKEITLTCNPHYRYGGDKSEAELEALLLADTMREFISYAVGCMFGRYSVDEPGLILANQGETLEDYLRKVPEPRFMPDADNVIPLIDFEGDWFEDDISERFKQFLKVTFGEDHFQENLQFIEDALGKDIRKFFLKDFYNDHTKRYKKRPIYWLFSSPKGSFNALIYMHRYRPDTASVVLNDYLREFRTKLSARKESYEQTAISISASPADKAKALKSIEKINKVLEEVNDYERDLLYPLAGKNIAIDLDDGVKKNYLLFGNALKKIAGLDAKED